MLNRIHRHGSFVYEKVRFLEEGGELALEAEIRPRINGRLKCSGCGEPRPGYDTLKVRRFEFIPIWGMAVYFVYAMRRVDCPDCGIVVESVPWGSGKRQATTTYAWFLAGWAKRLSWSEVAEARRLDIYLDFERGGAFRCPECGSEGCPAYDTTEKSWRHLNFFQHEAYLHARLPRVECPECGVKQVEGVALRSQGRSGLQAG